MSIIQVNNLTKTYRITNRKEGLKSALRSLIYPDKSTVLAVDNISFEINRGDIVGFVGPNGAGKSTIVKILSGILVPTSGTVYVNGIEPYKYRKKNAKNIGVVFGQRTQLWWDIPVIETYSLLKEIYKIPKDEYKRRLDTFSDILDLKDIVNKPTRQLSLGQRMRADLAGALLHDPPILFLDEPTIGLDVMVKEKIRTVLAEINKSRGTMIFLTTHDMQDIQKLSNKLILIDKGHMIYYGSTTDLRNEYDLYEEIFVRVDRAERIKLSEAFEGYHITITEQEDRIKFRYLKADYTASQILCMILQFAGVNDIQIYETQLEDIIKHIYNK